MKSQKRGRPKKNQTNDSNEKKNDKSLIDEGESSIQKKVCTIQSKLKLETSLPNSENKFTKSLKKKDWDKIIKYIEESKKTSDETLIQGLISEFKFTKVQSKLALSTAKKKLQFKQYQQESIDSQNSKKKDKEEKKDKKEKSEEKKLPGKRGYKICSNPKGCDNQLYIRSLKCDKCGFVFLKKEDDDKVKEDQHDLNSIRKLQKKSKIPKKYQDSVYTIKKNILYKNEFSLDQKQYTQQMFQDQSAYLNKIFKQKADFQKSDKVLKTILKKEKDAKILVKNTDEKLTLKPLQSYDFNIENQENWEEYVINLGFPILCMDWALRSNQKSKNNNQYVAVSAEINQDDNNHQNYKTLQENDLLHFHRVGIKYNEKDGIVFIFEIASSKDEGYPKPPTLFMGINLKNCSCLQCKWLPKYTSNQEYIGILGCLTTDGTLQFYAIGKNLKEQGQLINMDPILKIKINEKVILSCFDQLNNQECNLIATGDQLGNIYIIEIKEKSESQEKFEYQIIKYYFQAHMAEINDLSFYKNNLNREEACLLATCSYDGVVKVFDINESEFPIFQKEISSKNIRQITWDEGGRYLLVQQDELTSIQIISFAACVKYKYLQMLEEIELRILTSMINEHTILNFCGNVFSQDIYFSNSGGEIFKASKQALRKLAVKRMKSNKDCNEEGILFSTMSFDQENKQFQINCEMIKKDEQQDQEKQASKKIWNINFGDRIQAIQLCQNNITDLNYKVDDKVLETFLAYGNLSGILRISKIYQKC